MSKSTSLLLSLGVCAIIGGGALLVTLLASKGSTDNRSRADEFTNLKFWDFLGSAEGWTANCRVFAAAPPSLFLVQAGTIQMAPGKGKVGTCISYKQPISLKAGNKYAVVRLAVKGYNKANLLDVNIPDASDHSTSPGRKIYALQRNIAVDNQMHEYKMKFFTNLPARFEGSPIAPIWSTTAFLGSRVEVAVSGVQGSANSADNVVTIDSVRLVEE